MHSRAAWAPDSGTKNLPPSADYWAKFAHFLQQNGEFFDKRPLKDHDSSANCPKAARIDRQMPIAIDECNLIVTAQVSVT